MGLGKQAKTLSRGQIDATLAYLATTRHAKRNRLIFLLSAKAGLRAKEIAGLTWWMTNDSQGAGRPDNPPPGHRQQGQVGALDPAERGSQGSPDRIPERGYRLLRTPRHQYRAIAGNIGAGRS